MRQLGERRRPRTERGPAAALVAVAAFLALTLVSAAPASAQSTRADADRLQREAANRWVARDFAEADRLYGEAIEAFAAAGDRHMTAFALSKRALVRLNLRRWDDAAADARRADALFSAAIAELDPAAPGATDTNSPLNLARRGRAGALGSLRDAVLEQGRLAEAERWQREQISLWEALGDENPAGLASGYEGLAEIVERAGRHAEAAEHYELAASFWQRSGEIYASDFVEQRRRESLAGAQAARRLAAAPAPPVAASRVAATTETPETSPEPIQVQTRPDGEVGDAAVADGESSPTPPDQQTAEPTTTPAGTVPEAVAEVVRLVGGALATLRPFLVPLVFGSVVLMVIVKSAQQRKRARNAVLQHRAMDAQGRVRAVSLGAPPRELPSGGRAQAAVGARPPAASDLPPPVVGGAGRAVIEHKGTGWCGCIALVVVITGLAVLIPWLLRTLDVL